MPAPRGNVVPAPVPTPTPVTAGMASLTAPPPLDVSEDARRADALPDGADSPSGSAPVPSIGRPGSAASAWPRPVVRPLAPQRYEIRFTAGLQTRDKLREAQDLLSHAIPNGDVAEVVDRALTVLLVELRRRKFAATKRRRSAPTEAEVGASGSRAGGASSAAGGDGPARRSDTTTGGGDAPPSESESPATVKREVWQRDGGRCAFVAVDGQRCSATRLLEFHHVLPRGAGGR